MFYDYLSLYDNKECFNWETSNNLISNVNVDRGDKSKYLKLFNEEYTILSVCSLFLYTSCSCIYIKYFFILHESMTSRVVIIILYSILWLVALLICFFIHRVSCMKNNMMKSTEAFVELYIKRAVELGIISNEKYYDALQELDPKRQI